jgi:hypothetical protein
MNDASSSMHWLACMSWLAARHGLRLLCFKSSGSVVLLAGGCTLAAAAPAAGLTAASLGVLVPAGGVPGLPLPVVLVDEGLLLVMRERMKAMAAAVTTAQKEAQYQV